MIDSLPVRRFKGLGHLLRDEQRFIEWNRPLRDAIGERRPLDQLHHEGLDPVRFLEAVDVCDVGVIQGRDHFRFALEPREACRIGSKRLRQDLDRDLALEPRIAGPIHLPHAAGADLRGNFIRTKPGASGQGHAAEGNSSVATESPLHQSDNDEGTRGPIPHLTCDPHVRML